MEASCAEAAGNREVYKEAVRNGEAYVRRAEGGMRKTAGYRAAGGMRKAAGCGATGGMRKAAGYRAAVGMRKATGCRAAVGMRKAAGYKADGRWGAMPDTEGPVGQTEQGMYRIAGKVN